MVVVSRGGGDGADVVGVVDKLALLGSRAECAFTPRSCLSSRRCYQRHLRSGANMLRGRRYRLDYTSYVLLGDFHWMSGGSSVCLYLRTRYQVSSPIMQAVFFRGRGFSGKDIVYADALCAG